MSDLTDTSPDNPEPWDFSKRPAADIVVINIGTNDQNSHNNVSTTVYIDALTKIIQGVHGKWPKAQVVVMVCLDPLPTLLPPIVGIHPHSHRNFPYIVSLARLLPIRQHLPAQRAPGLRQRDLPDVQVVQLRRIPPEPDRVRRSDKKDIEDR